MARSAALATVFALLVPTLCVPEVSAGAPVTTISAETALPTAPVAEPAVLAEPAERTVEPSLASACEDPKARSRWDGRRSDDDWIPGLYPAHETYGENLLALTFDDGPHPSRTPIALKELGRRDMHATFFLTGHAIRSSTYELVQQMVREGHTLANHGWRHDTNMARQVEDIAELEAYIGAEFELTQIRVDMAMVATSAEDFAALDKEIFAGLSWFRHDRSEQLERMPRLRKRYQAAMAARGYGEGEHPVTLSWARPPGGNPYLGKRWTNDEREAFARVVNAQGLRMVMWSDGSGDSDTNLSPSERMDPERVAATARKAARRGGIYVAHDRIDPEALRAMLAAIDASEVEVVALERLRRIELGCGE